MELRNMQTQTKTLTPALLRRMDASWRAVFPPQVMHALSRHRADGDED